MPSIYGKSLDRLALRRRLGNLGAAAGVKLVTLSDGAERGVRCLVFRNWNGLRFTVLVDRGMDIGDLEWKGTPIGWQSPTGYRAPWLTDSESEGGLGILRSFSGFLITCGFDHVRRPEVDADSHFNSSVRSEIHYPLHGRGALQPARLKGYGSTWVEDELLLWCEGEVHQASLFAETIVLTRRIEVTAGGSRIQISDVVQNVGFQSTPHMQLYHLNIGWPILEEGSLFFAPIKDTIWSNLTEQTQAIGCFTQSGPQQQPGQQLFVHRVNKDVEGLVTAALVNPSIQLGVSVTWSKAQLPWLQQWQCLTEGIFAFGIEPVTNRFGSRRDLNASDEIEILESQQQRNYELAVDIIEGAEPLTSLMRRIDAMSAPREDFPRRTGNVSP